MVRFKRIRRVSFDAGELNAMLMASLPETLDIVIPGGNGQLMILESTLEMPADSIRVSLLCAFDIQMLNKKIYKAHLQVIVEGAPAYCASNKRIRLTDVRLSKIKLISDNYALINNGKELLTDLIPNPVKSIFNITVGTAIDIFTPSMMKDIKDYLFLYSAGSIQKVLDYHKPDIEHAVLRRFDDEGFQYQMDDGIFEENVFSQLGKHVKVEQGQLHFVFHD